MKHYLFIMALALILLTACSPELTQEELPAQTESYLSTAASTPSPPDTAAAIPAIKTTNTQTLQDLSIIPQFVNVNYIDLDKIQKISLFRSSEGHDFSDEFESCRSMKHYFKPYEDIDWSDVQIISPVDGEVVKLVEEWAGTQIRIKPDANQEFIIVIFHVDIKEEIFVGQRLEAGQQLGTHISNKTNSDIAVGRNTQQGFQWVSYFDVMSDELLLEYQIRGVKDRSSLIISREMRESDPLACDGETFIDRGNINNYYLLDD